jgi:hypothetical protein
MKKLLFLLIVGAALAALLQPTGCKIVSGTFVVDTVFYDLTPNGTGDYYYEALDLTTNDVWIDHEDDIKDIDNIGFEMWLSNTAGTNNFVDCYIADFGSALNGASSRSAVESGATRVLVDVPMPPGTSFLGYASSFSHIEHLTELKTLGESGQFKFWALADITTSEFTIDSLRVVLTLTAGS